ncbi:superantigen-like protein SSL4 [Novosphingobium beihaiensis]|uniref:LPXTG-motif cell wall-anchored protein n=1 Tax=Novosphingobium beihaiensis TaxID=2930389 RepID=A0ABT0BP24_9SPHN|nr:hypothetical protein [Novosphingobium beihaiensis]MCJ2186799.1 hypothetical protein [Novosphingobium beihaiensis]
MFRARAAAALIAALCAAPALPQSLSGWSLPTPEPSGTPPAAQGPVDTQNPVVRPAAPETAPSTPPSPEAASPKPAPRPSDTPVPKSAPTASTPAQAAPESSPRHPAAPAPAATAPASALPAATATPEAHSAPAAPEPPPVASPAPEGEWPLWWWALPAALAVLAAGLLLLRRRSQNAPPEGTALADTPAAPRPAPPPPAFAPAPSPPAERPRASGDLMFEPQTMRLSLVYATLQFRLVLTAKTAIPPGKLLADMISAHTSLPQAMQLAPPPEALGTVHSFPRMSPGEVLDLKGELQLPLAAVRPLQRGKAAFLVPLVRLALLGENDPALPRLELGFAFTVGLPGEGPSLAPLRLDTGPRDFTGLDAREIETARRTVLLALDPDRAAG